MATSLTNTGVTFPDATSQTTAGVPADGTGASGTWAIDISGNAATATSATSATSATNATNVTGATTASIQDSTLGSGTADATTYLRGDRTWASVAGGVTSLNGQTGAVVTTNQNSIGSIVADTGSSVSGISYAERGNNATVAGSRIGLLSMNTGGYVGFGTFSGTWRNMGPNYYTTPVNTYSGPVIWMRIS